MVEKVLECGILSECPEPSSHVSNLLVKKNVMEIFGHLFNNATIKNAAFF
jgi:hypothetical protein